MNPKIIELRTLLSEKFPNPILRSLGQFSSGIPWLDQSGGLPRGALIELVRPRSGTGSAMTLLAIMRHSIDQGRHVALVDGADSFDPESLTEEQRKAVLWVRCSGAGMAVKAMDLLLRDGNLPVIILDLACNSVHEVERIPLMTWHRIQRICEDNGNAAFIITPSPVVSSARRRFELAAELKLEELSRLRGSLIKTLSSKMLFTKEYSTVSA